VSKAADIEKAIVAELVGLEQSTKRAITRSEIDSIGKDVVSAMKAMISKGISPIAGAGRFPEYKAASKAKAARKEAKARGERAPPRTGYPYSVQDKYPEKRERPVNLKLKGDFLESLDALASVGSQHIGLTIGFTDPLSIKKEQGHREGVGGQPSSPIIPENNERFTPAIEKILIDGFLGVIRRAVARLK
jgi:hypothetical protein